MKVLLCLLLAGCTSSQYLVQRHTCPAAPTLPIVMESELATLTDATYKALVERELLLKEYIRLLEVYCDKRN